MTHIIMSGPIKPLTEVEKAFARCKLRKLKSGFEEPKVVERPHRIYGFRGPALEAL